MTDKQLGRSATDNSHHHEPGVNIPNPEARTQRPRAAVRRAARLGLLLAVENEPAPLPVGVCTAVANERKRILRIMESQRLAERVGLIVNLEPAITTGASLASIHIGLKRLATEDGKSPEQIAAAGVLLLHSGRA